jgi:hypothetical protein
MRADYTNFESRELVTLKETSEKIRTGVSVGGLGAKYANIAHWKNLALGCDLIHRMRQSSTSLTGTQETNGHWAQRDW